MVSEKDSRVCLALTVCFLLWFLLGTLIEIPRGGGGGRGQAYLFLFSRIQQLHHKNQPMPLLILPGKFLWTPVNELTIGRIFFVNF